jgi:hypothetical protein
MKRLLRPLLVLSLCFAALPAGARMYRWVDAQGQVHYAQLPPAQGAYEVIDRPASAPPSSPVPASTPEQEQEQEPAQAQDSETRRFLDQAEAAERAAAEDKARQQQAQAEARTLCEQARQRLAQLDERTARRLAVENPDGTMARMDEEEFERRRAVAQQLIQENCR